MIDAQNRAVKSGNFETNGAVRVFEVRYALRGPYNSERTTRAYAFTTHGLCRGCVLFTAGIIINKR